jgi:hypothetical protein
VTVRYPIASNAETALSAPVGRAVREREAQAIACEPVEFVRELTGPAFTNREAALKAYAGRVDAEGSGPVEPEDRYCELAEVAAEVGGRRPIAGQAQPTFRDGRRWQQPKRMLDTVWRLSIGYWRPLANRPQPVFDQARKARRSDDALRLRPEELRALAHQPLRPVRPQQPLDIGLFEMRLPENPDIIVPDE